MPPPAGQAKVPGQYGHRFPVLIQLRHRPAGDGHTGMQRELPSVPFDVRSLRAPTSLEEGVPSGWLVGCQILEACLPHFKEGEKHILSVRIGDACRWSAWSAFSKPVHLKLPTLTAPTGGLEVAVQSASGGVRCSWLALSSELRVPVECAVWLRALGPDGEDAKDGQQLAAFHLDRVEKAASTTSVALNVGRLDAGRQYRFALMARPACYVLGVPAWMEVCSHGPVTWLADSLVDPTAGAVVPESWDLPIPAPLSVPDSLESAGGRWRGRAVLLSWPKGIPISEDPPLELQACGGETGADPVRGWAAVSWTLLRVQELPCIAASPLPFGLVRFRWYSRDRRMAGPRSELCFAGGGEAPPEPAIAVFCTPTAVRLHVQAAWSRDVPQPQHPLVQVRFQAAAAPSEESPSGEVASPSSGAGRNCNWQVGPQTELVLLADDDGDGTHLHFTLGVEDGLEFGQTYTLAYRFGDRRRRSPWSPSSSPVRFDVPAASIPKAGQGCVLQVEALSTTAVRFWWQELKATLATRTPGPESRERKSVAATDDLDLEPFSDPDHVSAGREGGGDDDSVRTLRCDDDGLLIAAAGGDVSGLDRFGLDAANRDMHAAEGSEVPELPELLRARSDFDYWDNSQTNMSSARSRLSNSLQNIDTKERWKSTGGLLGDKADRGAPQSSLLSGFSSPAGSPKLRTSRTCKSDDTSNSMDHANVVRGGSMSWVRGEMVGRGSLGSVFKALNRSSGQLMAVKEVHFNTSDEEDDKFRASLQNEIDLYKDLQHPNIVSYLGNDFLDGRLFIYLEYMPGGSIAQVLSQFGPLDEPVVARYARHLLEGLEYLHTRSPPVLHRDIKGANILVGVDREVKLSDFGCSKRSAGTMVQTLRGSVPWMAPEVMRQSAYGRAADIWSFGCVLIEMASAKCPWGSFDNHLAAMVRIAMSEETPDIPGHLSSTARDLIRSCTTRDPQERPSATQLLVNEFLSAGFAYTGIDESWGT